MDTGTPSVRTARRPTARSPRGIGLVIGLGALAAIVAAPAFLGTDAPGRAVAQDATPAETQDAETPVTTGQVGAAACPAALHGEGAEPWVRTELYFGTENPDGTPFPEEDWLDFLDAEITPRFPDGLTVLTGLGQFREEGEIKQERSEVLIILYPAETAAESSALLEEIRDAYEQQFQQSSVLRADIAPVCTSF